MKIYLPWYPALLSPNARVHRMKKANIFKEAKAHGFYCVGGVRLKNTQGNIPLKIIFNAPDNRKRDLDNCLSSCKAYIDGIAQAFGVNDSQFRPITIDFGEAKKYGEIIVEVLQNV